MARFFKKWLFTLLPLFLLFASLESVQRVRYSIRYHDRSWLLYGLFHVNQGPAIKKTWLDPSLLRAGSGNIYIVCLGSSTTAGVFNDESNKYPHLLGELLRKAMPAGSRVRFEVVNAGLSGETSDAYGRAISELLSEITPAVVILYSGFSDIFVKEVNENYASTQAQLGEWWMRAERYSLVLMTAKERYLFWTQNRRPADYQARLEREFENNVQRAVQALRARGVKVVLVPEVLMARQFGPLRDYRDYARLYQHIPGILQGIAARTGAEFLMVRDAFDVDDFAKLLQDPVHLTNEGNHVLSRAIFDRSTTLQQVVAEAR